MSNYINGVIPSTGGLVNSVNGKAGDVILSKTDIELGNVTNDAQVKKATSSTDNAIARFDGTTGNAVQNSLVTIDDTGNVNIPSGKQYKINNVALSYEALGAASASHNHTGTYEPTITNLPIERGGTGQQTANNALNALLPSQSGNTSKVLSTNGTNSKWTSLGYVDILDFNCPTDGISDCSSAFTSALSSIGSTSKVLKLGSLTYNLGLPITIPSNVILKCDPGVFIKTNTNVQLTLNCYIDAGTYRIFYVGASIQGEITNSTIYPEWFGAVRDGITSSDNSIIKAITWAGYGEKSVRIDANLTHNLDFTSYTFPLGVKVYEEKTNKIWDMNPSTVYATIDVVRKIKSSDFGSGPAVLGRISTPSGQVTSGSAGVQGHLENFADAIPGNVMGSVALYGTGYKHGTASTWGLCTECHDFAGGSTGGAMYGAEIGIFVDGADTNKNRHGILVVAGGLNSGVVTNGIHIVSSTTAGRYTSADITYGINFTEASIADSAIKMASDQYITLGGTAAYPIKIKYNGTTGYIEFYRGSSRKGYINMSGTDHAL